MAWWDRMGRQDEQQMAPRSGESVYEHRPGPELEEDGWHKVGELDPSTARWLSPPDWSLGWSPFPDPASWRGF
jgi:hypothetical protein